MAYPRKIADFQLQMSVNRVVGWEIKWRKLRVFRSWQGRLAEEGNRGIITGDHQRTAIIINDLTDVLEINGFAFNIDPLTQSAQVNSRLSASRCQRIGPGIWQVESGLKAVHHIVAQAEIGADAEVARQSERRGYSRNCLRINAISRIKYEFKPNAFRKPFTGRAIAYTSTASFFNRFMFIKVISSIICIAFL